MSSRIYQGEETVVNNPFAGTLSLGRVIVNEIKKRIERVPTMDLGIIETVNLVDISGDKVSQSYTLDVRIPDREITLTNVQVASQMLGDGFGSHYIPQVGQQVVLGFMNKQIEQAIVLGIVNKNFGEVPETFFGQSTTKPSEIRQNEWFNIKKALSGANIGKYAEVTITKDNEINIRQLDTDGSTILASISIDASGNVDVQSGGSLRLADSSNHGISVSAGAMTIAASSLNIDTTGTI